MVSVLEAFLSVLIYILIRKGTAILHADSKMNVFTTEEVLSLAILGTLVIAGLRDLGIYGVQVRSVICIFFVLILARAKGAGIGAASGVIMGLISGLTGSANFGVVGAYALSGLLAGIFRKLEKIGVIIGFITGNAVLTYCLNGSTEVLIPLVDVTLASIIFYILPTRIINKAGSLFDDDALGMDEGKNEHLGGTNKAIDKLNAFSKAVDELAATFNKIPQPEQVPGDMDITNFFDTVVERVCKDCSLCLYCWDRNFQSTYQAMFTMLEQLESKGCLQSVDVPACFSNDSCARPKELINTMNSLYEVYRVNVMWKRRVSESRGLVFQQLHGVSKIISQLANEIHAETSYKNDIEAKLVSQLDNKGFDIEEVSIGYEKDGEMSVLIQSRGCPGMKKCRTEMDEIVCQTVGKRMVRGGFVCSPEKTRAKCMIRYTCVENFGITVGATSVSKYSNVESGDSYSFMELSDKKYILGLSDGMGTGEIAARNSKMAIDLLEKFLETGFDRDTAVKIINSAMVLKSADETYATIDISAIDLYTGAVEFVKIGAPPAYIKRKNCIEVVKGESLPAGIIENLDLDLHSKMVEAGDFVVMVTDGIADSNWQKEECGDWLVDFLEETETVNPQELAELILKRAIRNFGEKVGDDMTVLVAKVWKKV